MALPVFQFYLSASDGSKVARWLSDPSGRQGGSEVALSLLMLPEVALLIHEGREVERWLSLLMVARWQGGRAASLMVERWQRCQRWLCLPADGSEVARWQGGRTGRGSEVALLIHEGREVARWLSPCHLIYI